MKKYYLTVLIGGGCTKEFRVNAYDVVSSDKGYYEFLTRNTKTGFTDILVATYPIQHTIIELIEEIKE